MVLVEHGSVEQSTPGGGTLKRMFFDSKREMTSGSLARKVPNSDANVSSYCDLNTGLDKYVSKCAGHIVIDTGHIVKGVTS